MAKKPDAAEPSRQESLDFSAVIKTTAVRSRDEILRYSPIDETTKYAAKAVQMEREWEDVIDKAWRGLQKEDAAALYLSLFDDFVGKIEAGDKAPARSRVLENVAYRGFGMTPAHFSVRRPPPGGAGRHRVSIDRSAVESRLRENIAGGAFLRDYRAAPAAGPLRVAGSDVSQHISAVPVPGRFFRWTAPFALNNAAGALATIKDGGTRFENLFDPKPNDELLRWMLVDPSYLDDLEPSDYAACLLSAMDVGHYKFDLTHLLKDDRNVPDVVFRDGSVYPQDAYLDNYVRDDRRGAFVREAVRELLNCFSYVRNLGARTIYCGVAKSVQMKVFSAALDWFIADRIDRKWDAFGYNLNDGVAMSILLARPSFKASSGSAVGTCLLARDFVARANLNRKIRRDESLDDYFRRFDAENPGFDTAPFRGLCDVGRLHMFYLGHSASPQQRLPRYEFFHHDGMPEPVKAAESVFAALNACGLNIDREHSHMSKDEIAYLVPSPVLVAHDLSKQVGKHIDQQTGAKIMARFKSAISA